MADDKTEAMMCNDGEADSGIASNESDSRRDSLSSVVSNSLSAASSSNDSAFASMSDRRSSTSSNVSSMSGMSDLSRSSRTSGQSSVGCPDSVSSSRRSSLSSVLSDDSTTTLRSNVTATSRKSGQTSMVNHQQGYVSQSSATANSTSGYTGVSSPYSYDQGGQTRTTNTAPSSGLIQIQVVDYAGKTHIVRVRRTDKVKDLKVKVQEKVNLTPCQQRLDFQGKILDDRSTCSLQSQGIGEMSTVRLQGRLLGGALSK